MARRVAPKSIAELAKEWDTIAPLRRKQLISGDDISFSRVLTPALLAELSGASTEAVLDVGCGTGVFTEMLRGRFGRIVGVDPSRSSIDEAVRSSAGGVTYIAASIEEYAAAGPREFSAVVANMTLMDAPNLFEVLDAIGRACASGGVFSFTITHPLFWPRYWGYETADWFRYSEEVYVESDFRTSLTDAGAATTHIHRPLEMYANALSDAGFKIMRIREPMPERTLEGKYPKAWEYPRFLVVTSLKDRTPM